ncbi:hypothetical protein [Nonomuraea sp. NPDC048916]
MVNDGGGLCLTVPGGSTSDGVRRLAQTNSCDSAATRGPDLRLTPG